MHKSALILLLAFFLPQVVSAQTSFIDTTFGNSGVMIHDFFSINLVNDVLVQPDDKIVVFGYCSLPGFPTSRNLALTRYMPDGEIDSTFSVDGIDTADFNNYDDWSWRVALDGAGNLVTASKTWSGMIMDLLCLRRVTPTGDQDVTFGSNGRVAIPLSGGNLLNRALLIRASGKILCGGHQYISGNTSDIFLMQFLPDGSVDSAFSVNGLYAPITSISDELYDLEEQPDGSILAAGFADSAFMVMRFDSSGIPDPTFNNTGILIDSLAGAKSTDLILQPDGRILVGGFCHEPPKHVTVARYMSDGTPDISFGTGGRIHSTVIASVQDVKIALQPDGRILITGRDSLGLGTTVLSRFNSDGTIDLSFGLNGEIFNSYGNQFSVPIDIVLQSTGKIVLAGIVLPIGLDSDVSLMRYGNQVNTGHSDAVLYDNTIQPFPNPISDIGTVVFSNPEGHKIIFSLLDCTGRLVESIETTDESIFLDAGNYRPGVYFLKMTDDLVGTMRVGRVVFCQE